MNKEARYIVLASLLSSLTVTIVDCECEMLNSQTVWPITNIIRQWTQMRLNGLRGFPIAIVCSAIMPVGTTRFHVL